MKIETDTSLFRSPDSGWQAYYVRKSDEQIVGCVSHNGLFSQRLSNVGTFMSSARLSQVAKYLLSAPSPISEPVTVSIVWHDGDEK